MAYIGNICSASSGSITGGTLTGSLILVSDPTLPLEAATKQYVDTQIAASGNLTVWTAKTAAYTAVNGDKILADTSSAAFTITLPAAPLVGQQVTITDAGGTFSTNNLTVNRNGSKILGIAQDLILDVAYQCTTLVYYNSTNGWVFGN